ncbi:TetR/AcrR family transcriptional regulator [Rubrivivax sp. JA1026]|uniref:TetR/AcrR family transcriptional regulator n=1 Tax=Rubrivivax sp. JA1026 TaxID=2710888 RepID=UPI0013E965BC|nr:TetR/AcrR family transcriptional regulator [Rubrivivax sp. JA1026]
MAASPPVVPRRRRSAKARAEFRSALVREAGRLLREGGAAAVTIRSVTEALGVSQMAFYTYFESKAALLRACWRDSLLELQRALVAAAAPGDEPSAVLHAHAMTFLRYWETQPDLYSLVYNPRQPARPSGETVRAEAVYLEMQALAQRRIAAVLGSGVAFDDPLVVELTAHAFTKVVGYLHTVIELRRHEGAELDRLRERVVSDIVDAVRRCRAPRIEDRI